MVFFDLLEYMSFLLVVAVVCSELDEEIAASFFCPNIIPMAMICPLVPFDITTGP